MDTMEVKLKHPVTTKEGTVVVDTVTLRRAQVRHLKATDGMQGDVAKTAALISELSDIPPGQVDLIDAEDFAVLAEKVGSFFK